MIVPDLNLLLYAYDAESPHHPAAAAWWESCINGGEPVGLPHVVLFGFVRLATSARVFVSPTSLEEAVGCVRAWLEQPYVVEAEGGPEHVSSVLDLLLRSGTGGSLSNRCADCRRHSPSRRDSLHQRLGLPSLSRSEDEEPACKLTAKAGR